MSSVPPDSRAARLRAAVESMPPGPSRDRFAELLEQLTGEHAEPPPLDMRATDTPAEVRADDAWPTAAEPDPGPDPDEDTGETVLPPVQESWTPEPTLPPASSTPPPPPPPPGENPVTLRLPSHAHLPTPSQQRPESRRRFRKRRDS